MREIKFRAYHIEQEKMINIENLLSFSNDGDIWINENKQMPLNVFSGWASKDFKLMQYTGLKDKNGVEIYEGDIIKVLGDKSTVFWQQGAFKFQNISNYNIQPLFDFATINKCVAYEVIGNIYENPELLENDK